MIFVTVGTELPFDRLVRVVDQWAREHGRTDVFAQIGHTAWRPTFIPFAGFLEPSEFNRAFARASVIVAHAGMGTILSALRYEKPLLVMPRRAALGEQRNDHQIATARRLLELGKIHVALDESELARRLATLEQLQVRDTTGAFASDSLLEAVHDFAHREKPAKALSRSDRTPNAPAAGLPATQ
jgi:UDP-N-acetylglucosamine transferase subunit ALG13